MPYDITFRRNLEEKKNIYKWTYSQNIKRLTDTENKLAVTKREKEDGEGQIKSIGLTDTNYYI